jgi:membrane peptidoglycan carboxypeptidase
MFTCLDEADPEIEAPAEIVVESGGDVVTVDVIISNIGVSNPLTLSPAPAVGGTDGASFTVKSFPATIAAGATGTIVRQALRDVVASEKGTGKRARMGNVAVAGKTGTAQVIRMDDRDPKADKPPRKERDHAWFACYAPADAPEIVIVVLVEHGGHGGEAAAPIAREILEEYFGSTRREEMPSTPAAPQVGG